MQKVYRFQRSTNGFDYLFEESLQSNEEIVLKMPSVSPNKRGVNDIGWQTDGDAVLYATLSYKPFAENTIWTKIEDYDDVNKTISYIKIVNGDRECNIAIRALLN